LSGVSVGRNRLATLRNVQGVGGLDGADEQVLLDRPVADEDQRGTLPGYRA
jgi:hypothetical protein